MRERVRENAPVAALGLLATAVMTWLGLYGFVWNDYEVEAQPAFAALVHGHLELFLRSAPVYGGSFVERAPFALIPGLWGGGELAVYRLVALPCLLGVAVLAVWLAADMRALGRSTLARAIAVGVCLANPLTLRALELGHPEDLLGGALCVAAVLLALRGRPLWAGLLLGAAIANKEWAVLALGPVLLALPARRSLCLAMAVAATGAVLAPLALVHAGSFLASARGTAAPTSTIFQPWQVWWFLGHHGPVVRGLLGNVKVGYRTAPGWVGRVSHPLIVALALPLTGLFWWRRRGDTNVERGGSPSRERVGMSMGMGVAPDEPEGPARRATDALGLLALLFLLRCVLDTWDTSYYMLPCVLALLAWNVHGEPLGSAAPSRLPLLAWNVHGEPLGSPAPSRLPLLASGCTVLAWLSFQWLPAHVSADAQSALFLAWTLPLVAALALRLYAPALAARLCRHADAVLRRAGSLTAPDGALRKPRSAPWAAR
jgi:hypothetical protein